MLGDTLASCQTEWVLASSTVSVVLWQNISWFQYLIYMYAFLLVTWPSLSAPLVH